MILSVMGHYADHQEILHMIRNLTDLGILNYPHSAALFTKFILLNNVVENLVPEKYSHTTAGMELTTKRGSAALRSEKEMKLLVPMGVLTKPPTGTVVGY